MGDFPVRHILNFLSGCFQEGYEYNTITGFRPAVSAYHEPIDGVSIGINPRVRTLLSVIFDNRALQPRVTFI